MELAKLQGGKEECALKLRENCGNEKEEKVTLDIANCTMYLKFKNNKKRVYLKMNLNSDEDVGLEGAD
jgi:hypothetical protein